MTTLIDKAIVIDKDTTLPLSNQPISSAKKYLWLSAATISALLIFIVLNILPTCWHGLLDLHKEKKNSNYGLEKLQHYVQSSSYESEQFGPWPWWVARAYFLTPKPDIVIMGDSQINAAFIQADAIALNKSRDCVTDRGCIALKKSLQQLDKKKNDLHLVNLAVGGAMPSDYYLMSKAFFTKEYHPKLVVLSLSPRSFLDATLSSVSSTETFQFLSPYVNLGSLTNYAFSNPVEKYFWLIKNELAVFKYRQDINLTIHTFLEQLFGFIHNKAPNNNTEEILFNRLGAQAIYGGNGFVTVGSSVVTPNPNVPFRGNKAEYQRRFAQFKASTLAAQSAYFLASLRYLKDLGVKVIVVDMPMQKPVRDLLPASFWQDYSRQLKSNCQTEKALWLDLSNDAEFSQNDFLDYVHLNACGGQKFVDRLANFICH